MKSNVALLLVVLLLILVGCTAPSAEEPAGEVACTTDAGCPAGQSCHHGECEADIDPHED